MCKIEKVYIRKNTTYFYIDYPIIIIKTFYQIYMAKVCYIKTQKEVIIDIGIIREEPSKDLFYIYKLVEEEYGMILDFFEEKLDGDSWEEICQSCYRMMYLEISNGLEVVTLYRTAKHLKRSSKLVTVYYSPLDKINDDNILIEDMYVHMRNSATNIKGFHTFLEKFLHLDLPLVPATDGNQRKLYLQLIFSCMFIEQKHGWGDIFSGIPILGIKDSKKRVIEYVLNLDTIGIEKKKEELKFEEERIRSEWTVEIKEIQNTVNREICLISGIPMEPCEFTQITAKGIHIFKEEKSLDTFIQELKDEYKKLELIKPRVIDNFDELQKELEETEKDIEQFEEESHNLRIQLSKENTAISVLNNNLEIIDADIQNNKDAAKLRQLGSEIGCKSFENICPVCNQPIADSLFPVIEENEIMSIDENIRHVVENGLDVGFAYDGDADRCLCVDEKGNVVDGDAILYIYGRYMKERGKLLTNTVVTTVMSNFGLYKAFDELGIGYAKTAVGDKYVYEYMTKNGCRIGGEQSGHIIFSKYASTGDGILTSLKMMEVMMAKKKKLSQLTEDLHIYPQVLVNVMVKDKAVAQADADVQAAISKVAERLGDTGRILVRESGTEPLIRVMVEAETKEICHTYVDEVVSIINKKEAAR